MSGFLVGLCLSAAPANAACAPDPASSGQTVTCSGNTPGGFQAGGGVNNLTVNVLSGAAVSDGGGGVIIGVNDFNTVTNSGTLAAGPSSTGIFAGVNNTIVNAASGVITVGDGGSGIFAAGNSTVTNAGAMTIGDAAGLAAAIVAINDDNTVSNFAGATITAGQADGILMQGNRAIVNNAGTINVGAFGVGIDVFGDDALITSNGVINVADNAAGISAQGDRALITHLGTVNGGVGSAGVAYNGSSGTINNSGRILLGDDAFGIVVLGDSNTITNSGTITVGGGFAVGIDVSSFGGSNSVINTGTINVGAGGTGIGILLQGTGTVFNSGTINAATGFAAIELCGCGNSTLTLGPGSVINGLVLGNGTDTFQLGGTGKDTFNLSLIGAGQQYDGFSTFNKVDSSNWTVTGTGAQNWNVVGGTLAVNGVINGLVTVHAGGTLGGIGTVDNIIVNGGTLAPGNSTGTFNVAGSLTFSAASSYMVEISGTSSDLTRVTGVATLGGATVVVVPIGTVAKHYTILTATGGVPDTFNPVVSGVSSNLNPSLSYDTNNVYLNFALNYGGGLNLNQQNVANALTNFFNTTGGIPVGFASLSPAGLTQVSGELATGSQQGTFDAMNLFLSLISDPFVAGRNGGFGGNAGAVPFAEESALGYAAKKPRAARDAFAKFPTKADVARNDLFDQRWSVWGSAFGGGSNTSGNAALGSNDATARAFGFAVGADYRLSRDTLAGFALAGGGTNFSVSGFGSGRSDLFQAGAFVRHNIGKAYVTAAAAYGWQDVTTERTVTVAGFERLRAQFNANAWSGRIEGGYRYVTPWMGITPYAAGQFTTYSLPAYAEQVLAGAGTFALNYAAKDVTASRTELGVRTDKSFAVPSGILTLRGRAAWAHDFNTDRNVTALFQTLPGAAFVVNGAAQAHDSALITGAAEMKWLNGWSAAAIFEGQFSSVTNSYAGKGVARYSW
ncbi:autotransporter domain-containing protein [Bradyrhizobium sp. AUGA SZCCT0283]|uniref:autotransporter outer membrane beta-barrel domain-containing protein n=1 Tax=Bradyrhizobium sp. AUGA SZCCT0283 TaxID=2807671 RepID=UPI001BAE1E8F|nr:autotransporter domain-containing protein [Bradyrhizobium sp. AUGA SZCCT0283]MBR1275181.1 autotransporter domain-containing protein [Bradyrhizobium sp. AUGA SZCCT0283]